MSVCTDPRHPLMDQEISRLKKQLRTAQEVINKHATDGIEGLHCVDCVAEEDEICDCPMLVPFWEAMEGYENQGPVVKISVNGKECEARAPLTYEDILVLAGEREGASVICKPKDKRLAGFSLIMGQSCEVTEGMVINCMMIGNA